MPSRAQSNDYFGDDDSSITKASSMGMSKASSMHDDATERSPLLPPERGQVIDLPAKPQLWLSRKTLLLLLVLVVVLVSSGDQLMDSPQTRIIEAVICYRYYERVDPSKLLVGREGVGPGAIGGVAEMHCKADEVQKQLALLRGYQQLFDGIPALLLALPFGWAADRYGRRPFLIMGLISYALRASWIQIVTWFWQAFDIKMTWLSTLSALLSGGDTVIVGLLFVILADVTLEQERASVFLRVGAFNLMANWLMPPLSAWLMDFNPWIPSLSGTFIELLAVVLGCFAPETLNYQHPDSPSASPRPGTPMEETPPAPPDLANSRGTIAANFAARWAGKLKHGMSILSDDWRVPALIIPFIGHSLVGGASQLLLQYMSKRYSVTFSRATLLLTIFNGVKVLLLFILLPYASTLIMRVFHLSGQKKDLYLSRGSMVMVFVGYTLVGLSPNIPTAVTSLVIASLGQGTYLLIRSFITSLVPDHHIARVYSLISLVDTAGAMFGGAVLAGLFNGGLNLGGAWIGLPFYFLGVISAGFVVLMFAVRLRKGEGELAEAENEDSVDDDT